MKSNTMTIVLMTRINYRGFFFFYLPRCFAKSKHFMMLNYSTIAEWKTTHALTKKKTEINIEKFCSNQTPISAL